MEPRIVILVAMWAGILVMHGMAVPGDSGQGDQEMRAEVRVRMSFAGKEAVAVLYDHPTTRDLLSRLPLTLTFRDYVGKEKIGYLDRKLSGDGSSPTGSGEFAYYAPWGNLAIFYQGTGYAGGGLVVLGSIQSGKAELAAMQTEFTMTLELVP